MARVALNLLIAFDTVAACGSISRAAKQLNLSQPAISGQIGRLERQVGQALFDRLPRQGVALTAAGSVFHQHVTEALALIDAGEHALQDLEGLQGGELHVGASSTTGTYLLPRACGVFRREHPQVALSLEIGNSAAILELLRSRVIDLGIIEEERWGDDFQVTPWLHDEIVLLAAADHPLRDVSRVTPHALWDHDFVHREQGIGTRETVAQHFKNIGLDLPPGTTFGSIEALKRAVAAGVGLGWVSRLAVVDELERGDLVTIAVANLSIHRHHHLVRPRHRRLKTAARVFVELLRDQQWTWHRDLVV